MGVFCQWTPIEINCHNIKIYRGSRKRVQTNEAVYLKEHSLKIVKMPGPMRMVWGSAIAYWLSGIINPAFIAIAVMIALFIPVLIADPLFPGRPEK